jgi:hypothetical protein
MEAIGIVVLVAALLTVVGALLDPLIAWWGYAVLQFILISEAWYVFGKTHPSIAVGNFFQRYCTTTEARRARGRGRILEPTSSSRRRPHGRRKARPNPGPVLAVTGAAFATSLRGSW